MSGRHQITIDGQSFEARQGELLLDAALKNGIELKHDCRAGHCGTCCVRVIAGRGQGGEGAEPGVVHACQCRVAGDLEVRTDHSQRERRVAGVVSSLRAVASDVFEVGITTDRAFPYLPGQYASVRFSGYPARPFSITHPLHAASKTRMVTFHIRRMEGGTVTSALGTHIVRGSPVELIGPYGSACFRPHQPGRLILVATSTGFAPIWSIAVAALRENPLRRIMVVAGARTIEQLYMGPALAQLARFPNVLAVPICSTPQSVSAAVRLGRPTDVLPRFVPGDQVYVCGAPPMVEAVKAIAAKSGVICYADPFVPAAGQKPAGGVLGRAREWFSIPSPKLPSVPRGSHAQPRQLASDGGRGLQI